VSLKAFHLFFIAVSVILSAFMTAWSVNRYQAAHDSAYALGVYGTMFQRKMRRL